MLSKIDIKKRIAIGISCTVVFYALIYVFTRFSTAQVGDFPATPPVTPPVTPPTLTPTISVTPTVTPADDGHATGGVTATFGGKTMKLTFNAHGGEDVKGNVNYSDSTGKSFKGDVDVCYEQQDNEAVFVGTIDSGTTSDQYFYIEVQDNGEGKKSSPDKLRVNTFLGAPDCSLSGLYPGKVTKGNLQVH